MIVDSTLITNISAELTAYPTTPGHTVIRLRSPLFIDVCKARDVLIVVKRIAKSLAAASSTQRCGLAYDGNRLIHLLPLHGVGAVWSSISSSEEDYRHRSLNYLSTRHGPKMDDHKLEEIRSRIVKGSDALKTFDTTFCGEDGNQNLFARIIRGEVPQWRIWESKTHVAFLTPYSSTLGFTVLVLRKHLSSDIFDLDDEDYEALMRAAHLVANLLKDFMGLTECGIFFEGLEIDYAHVKLVPVIKDDVTLGQKTETEAFYEQYLGFLSTRLGPLSENMNGICQLADEMRARLAPVASQKLSRSNNSKSVGRGVVPRLSCNNYLGCLPL
jgi:diadenosine tetraphosphate (Ap4A) HIT family hydrolase